MSPPQICPQEIPPPHPHVVCRQNWKCAAQHLRTRSCSKNQQTRWPHVWAGINSWWWWWSGAAVAAAILCVVKGCVYVRKYKAAAATPSGLVLWLGFGSYRPPPPPEGTAENEGLKRALSEHYKHTCWWAKRAHLLYYLLPIFPTRFMRYA
jgi:hypothetical protein